MRPHDRPHVSVHIQIAKADFDALRQLHPSYGERSRVLRQLLADYVATHEQPSSDAARGDA